MLDTNVIITSIHAALEAGKAILDVYHSDDFRVETKADDSPLTLADKRSHSIIVSRLRDFNIPILSEEGRDIPYEERRKWETLWIVDPLDGTKEFIKRNGEFTVNIALVERKVPFFGVVYAPDRNYLYVSETTLGAYKWEDINAVTALLEKGSQKRDKELLDAILQSGKQLPLARPEGMPYTIMGSRSHLTKEVEKLVEEKRAEHGTVDFISAGSSLKLCLVAEGKADIYPRLGPTMEWDTAAGQAVAQGAGGSVIRHDTKEPLTYNKEDLLNPWFIVKSVQRL